MKNERKPLIRSNFHSSMCIPSHPKRNDTGHRERCHVEFILLICIMFCFINPMDQTPTCEATRKSATHQTPPYIEPQCSVLCSPGTGPCSAADKSSPHLSINHFSFWTKFLCAFLISSMQAT